MCRVWARQKLRVITGLDHGGHVDGWATTTTLGKLREEREGASHGRAGQHFPEVFTGDGLRIARALIGMPELPLIVFQRHFLLTGPVADKAADVGISPSRFYTELDHAYYWIAAKLETQNSQE